jgi:hypothetical protein
MNTLEHELSAGLQERAGGVHLTRDVLAAARARHRRRTVVTRAASATGTVGLAGAIAAAVALNGPVTATGTTPSAPPSAASAAGVELDAATVSAKITDALLAWDESVHHLSTRFTIDGRTSRSELWEDPVTRDSRYRSSKGSSPQPMEMAVRVRGRVQTTTVVDTERRVWWVDTFRFTQGPTYPSDGSPLGDTSPEGLRAALTAGRWELVGEEKLKGRDTVHLRVTERAGYDGEYDLWVDATTYQFVRKTTVSRTDDGTVETVEDWEYLPRTKQVLSGLKVEAPRGFTKVRAPESNG